VQAFGVGGQGTVVMLQIEDEEQYWRQLSPSARTNLKLGSLWRGGGFGFSVEWLNVPKQEVIAEVRHRAGVDPHGQPSFRLGDLKK
jgi:hypothetical protein